MAATRGAKVMPSTVDLAAIRKTSDEQSPMRIASGSPATLIVKLTSQRPLRSREPARLGYLKSACATGFMSELKAMVKGLGSARSSAEAVGRTLATPAAIIACNSFMIKR